MAIFNTVYGGEPKWKPNANTVAYYPLNGDIKDYSGNNRDMSVKFWTATYWTLSSWKQYWSFWATWNTSWWWGWQTANLIDVSWNITVSYWGRFNWNKSWTRDVITNRYESWFRWMDNIDTNGTIMFHGNAHYNSTSTVTDNNWHNILCVVNSGTVYFYIDGSLDVSKSYSFGSSSAYLSLWYSWQNNTDERLNWDVSEIIIENTPRTADEVAKYYNRTKANYS